MNRPIINKDWISNQTASHKVKSSPRLDGVTGEFYQTLGEFHGLCSPCGHKEWDITEQLSLHFT